MFKGALFTTAKRCKQPKCPSADEWMNKLWYIQTMEYYSKQKQKQKLLISAKTQVTPENIMLSEQGPDAKGHMLYDSTDVKYPEMANPQRQKDLWWLVGARTGCKQE